jgi:AcrR family transcriptional regulator
VGAAGAAPDGRSRKRPGVAGQRSKLVDAAVDLFSEHGSTNVSIGALCRHADVSRPTFYRCFDDKDALLAAIYEEAVDAHVAGMLIRGRIGDASRLREELDRMLDGIFDNAALARLVFRESADPSSGAAAIVDRAFERAARELARGLARGGQEKPSSVYLKSLMAAIQWLVNDAIVKGLAPRHRRQAKDAVFTLVSRALAS